MTDIIFTHDLHKRRPNTSIHILPNPQRLEQFLAVWDWYLDEVRKANSQ